MSKEEIWKPIKGYEGLYEVSNLGNVKSLNYNNTGNEQLLRFNKDRNGYFKIKLYKDGKGKISTVHKIVANAFIPNPDEKPCLDHINTIKTDNRVENLKWVTLKENMNNPITRKHISKAIKDRWKDPIIRQHQMKGVKKSWQGSINRQHQMEGLLKRINKLKKPIVQLNKDYSFVRYWDCAYDVEKELGYNHSHINNCLKVRAKSAYGYIWKYKEEYDYREQIRLGMDNRKGVA